MNTNYKTADTIYNGFYFSINCKIDVFVVTERKNKTYDFILKSICKALDTLNIKYDTSKFTSDSIEYIKYGTQRANLEYTKTTKQEYFTIRGTDFTYVGIPVNELTVITE